MNFVEIDPEKCTRDLLCTMECPQKVLAVKREDGLPYMIKVGPRFCMQCGHCVAICPSGALSLYSMPSGDCEPVRRDLLPDITSVEHLLKSRRSIRNFKNTRLDREEIERIINIASYAPTGHNRQNVNWIIYEDRDKIHHLAELTAEWMKLTIEQKPDISAAMHLDLVLAAWKRGHDNIMRNAPDLAIAYSYDDSYNGAISCTIALTYLEIAAYASGVGSCWAGFFMAAAADYDPMIKELGMESGTRVHGALLLGYPSYHYFRIPMRKEPKVIFK